MTLTVTCMYVCSPLQVGWGLEADARILMRRSASRMNCYVDLQAFVHPASEASSLTEGVKPSCLHTAAQRFLNTAKPWPRGWAGRVQWAQPLVESSEEWQYAVTDVSLIWQLYLHFMPEGYLQLPSELPPMPPCPLTQALSHVSTAEAAAAVVRGYKFIREEDDSAHNAGVELTVKQLWHAHR